MNGMHPFYDIPLDKKVELPEGSFHNMYRIGESLVPKHIDISERERKARKIAALAAKLSSDDYSAEALLKMALKIAKKNK